MKLKYKMTTLEMDNELMAVPIGSDQDFRGILRMNGTTADILIELEEQTTEDEIIMSLFKKYNASEEEIRESVCMVINQLRECGLLED